MRWLCIRTCERPAEGHNTRVDRSKSVVRPVSRRRNNRAGTQDVEYGIEHSFQYFQAVAAFPQMAVPGNAQRDDLVHRRFRVRVRSARPTVTAQIDRLITQSNGKLGAYLMLAHDWADPRDVPQLRVDRPPRGRFPGPRAADPRRRRACARRALRPRRAAAKSRRSRDGGLCQGARLVEWAKTKPAQSSDRKVWNGRGCLGILCGACEAQEHVVLFEPARTPPTLVSGLRPKPDDRNPTARSTPGVRFSPCSECAVSVPPS